MQQSPDELRVGLVTDVGHVDDGTFNQYAYEGLMRAAEEHDLDPRIIETESPDDYEDNLERVVEEGYTLVVTVGSRTGPQVERLAARHSQVHFIVVDHEPSEGIRNVTGLVFAEDQAAYLAGALAGLVTEKGTVGFVGGPDIAPVRKFHRGFAHGLAQTSARAEMVDTTTNSFTDLEAGEAAGRELVAHGADVLFAAAGKSGAAAIRAAAQEGAWVIGVDQDQWVTTFEEGAVRGSERLLTSAVKRVDHAVYDAVTRAVKGRLHSGVVSFNLGNDGVGLAPYHEADAEVSSEVKGHINEIADGLRRGEIHTYVGPQGEDLREGWVTRLTAWNWRAVVMPLLAVVTALIIAGVFIGAFDPVVWEAFEDGVGAGLSAAWQSIATAYAALFAGAFGSPAAIVEGLQTYMSTGEATQFERAIRPLTESLRIATPFVFASLAVALGFRCGLFNIGAEGQYFIGGLATVFVGYAVTGLPWIIHLPLAIGAGFLGGAIWAGISGFLKAETGAHEVITTIMLNYVAYRVADYMLQVGGPMAAPGFRPVSPQIEPSAYLPQFFPRNPSIGFNTGVFLALAAAALVYWLLFKTTLGFEIRTVGASPRAARTAGMSVTKNFILAMALSGGLAGMAAVHDILGVIHFMPNAFYAGYGFDAIALALLGRSHPIGVVLASLLFGFLEAGAQRMQAPPASVPIDIISIVQALIIIFVAAPEVIRLIYRIRAPEEEREAVFTRGWGQT
ncbi:MAG: BMP family ABC transporter substrate-binding protein [Chloroflexota bacterium]|nr:BMP family ABC transporter substrate-binding protein [Chloroflexota bacterium]